MSTPTSLGVHVGDSRVTAVLRGEDGSTLVSGVDLVLDAPAPDRVEVAPEALWRAVLDTVGELLSHPDGAPPRTLGLGASTSALVLWDRDTLGAPRPAVAGADRRAVGVCARLRAEGHDVALEQATGLRPDPAHAGTRLVWLAEHEPHTWALVVAGRYAVGGAESYLLARMTRGLEHATDPTHAATTLLHDRDPAAGWSAVACDLLGVPLDALPEPEPTTGTTARPVAVTDPRTFLGLEVPLTALAAATSAGDLAALAAAGAA